MGFANTCESLCCLWGQEAPQGTSRHPLESLDTLWHQKATTGLLDTPWDLQTHVGPCAIRGISRHPAGLCSTHGVSRHPIGLLDTLWDQSAPEHPTEPMDTYGSLGYLYDQQTPMGFLDTLWDQGASLEFHNTPWNTCMSLCYPWDPTASLT